MIEKDPGYRPHTDTSKDLDERKEENKKDDLAELVTLAQAVPRERRQAAIDLLKNLITADQQPTPRESAERAAPAPRPKWETDALPGEDPASFAWRAYATEAAAGNLHRGVIHAEDPGLHRRLNSWLRSHDMPEGIDIPTFPEWNDRQVASGAGLPVVTDEVRKYRRAQARVARARHRRAPGV